MHPVAAAVLVLAGTIAWASAVALRGAIDGVPSVVLALLGLLQLVVGGRWLFPLPCIRPPGWIRDMPSASDDR